MRFTFISTCDEGLGLAIRLQREGHDVSVVMQREKCSAGNGLVDKVKLQNPLGASRDCIIELLMSKTDVFVVTSVELTGVAQALKTGLTRVLGPQACELVVENVGGFYTTYLYNGNRFLADTFLSKKDFKFLAGNLGPTVAEPMSVSTWRIPLHPQPALEQSLKATGFCGMVNVYEDQHVELGFDLPVFYNICELSRRTPADILISLANGNDIKLMCGVSSCCAQLSIPPYPYGKSMLSKRLFELEEGALNHTWLRNVELDEEYSTSNGSGIVAYVSAFGHLDVATGETDARKLVVNTLRRVPIADKQYRVDLCFHRDEGLRVVELLHKEVSS